MKKIAVTQRLIKNESYYEIREALDINFSKLIKACGFLPIILPYNIDFKEYFREFNIEGVILTGGNDLNNFKKNELSKKRDDFENRLIKFCIQSKIPILGICRGMQIIAEYFGSNFKKIHGEVGVRYKLKPNNNSRYYNYLKNLDLLNSYHNYTIEKISDEFLISGTDNKGIIKAIEHKKEKIFCQMWHSEREKKFRKSEIDLINGFFNHELFQVIKIVKKAGKKIMNFYKKNILVKYKKDTSPFTNADKLSNEIILNELKRFSTLPILTEEIEVKDSIRKAWSKFWLVDPLDGTKDFIAKNGNFSINIALIDKGEPVLGVVFIPETNDVYYATKNGGAFKNNTRIYNNSKRKKLIATESNFHSNKRTSNFFKKHKIKNIKKYGSSLKICKLAEGEIDIYPRFSSTKEWDIAAAHIIANEAGCKIIDLNTNKELSYNKRSIKNNHFIASRNSLDFII